MPRWRESDVCTPLERDVREYAEAMTQTPLTVTAAVSARLLEQLGAPALVEPTAGVAPAHQYARTNTALGVEAQGSRRPADWPRPPADRGVVPRHDPRRVRRPPQPARRAPPIAGAERVGAYLVGLVRATGGLEVVPVWLNGGPAAVFDIGGVLSTVACLEVSGGRMTRMYAVREPHELARVGVSARVTR